MVHVYGSAETTIKGEVANRRTEAEPCAKPVPMVALNENPRTCCAENVSAVQVILPPPAPIIANDPAVPPPPMETLGAARIGSSNA